MKILLAGSDFEYGIEQYYIKYLRQLGAEVIHYPAPDRVIQQRSKNIISRILFKTRMRTGYAIVNRELIRLAEENDPDVIWIFKGMEIYPSTLRHLGKKYRIANYNPDHPFIISSRGSGNDNVTGSVGLYQLHFCYNRNLQKQIEKKYGIPTVFLPFGFELSPEDYLTARQEPEINRICFIGNPDRIRVHLLTLLAKNGFGVDVYGHGWDKTPLRKFPGINISDAVYGQGFWKRLRQYRVQVNIFRKHNAGSHNMRSFEIPAVGGIQLAPWSEEQADFFSEGKEIFFYRDEDDLLKQVKNLLLATAETANGYREAARKRSLDAHYRYQDRALTVYENFKILIG